MSYVDFQEVKKNVSVTDAIDLLGLDMKFQNNQWRGQCPACQGSERGLVITPSKDVYYCFSDDKGGDVISLVAHVRDCSLKQAALFLQGEPTSSTKPKVEEKTVSLKPLEYLEADHPAVEALGFEPEDAERLGVGYAKRGYHRGLVAVPVRTDDGTLVGYVGVTEAKLPKDWRWGE